MRFAVAVCVFVLSISVNIHPRNAEQLRLMTIESRNPAMGWEHFDGKGGLTTQVQSSSHLKTQNDRISGASQDAFAMISTPDIAPDIDDSDREALAAITSDDFCRALASAAESNGIPVAFFARLIWQESKFKSDAVSPAGAKGVAQFMPATAAEYGLDDPFNPLKALPASARFLRQLHNQFGNLGLAAAAYNAGSGRIQNWLARRGPLPAETKNYVQIITGESAEKWTQESRNVALHMHLPRLAPCDGVAGLSRGGQAALITANLAPAISALVSNARLEAKRAAAALVKKKGKPALITAKEERKDPLAKTTTAMESGAPKTPIIQSERTRTALGEKFKEVSGQAARKHRIASAERQ